jgi:hypothetical protein
MGEKNQINERLSEFLYHFTTMENLKDILAMNLLYFNSESNEKFNYVSFTRNKMGSMGYGYVYQHPVRICFDGNKLNSTYKGGAHDWGYSDEDNKSGRMEQDKKYNVSLLDKESFTNRWTEMEDRIAVPAYTKYEKFGANVGIPNISNYITRIDIFNNNNIYIRFSALLTLAQKLNIDDRIFIYARKSDFDIQNEKCDTLGGYVKKIILHQMECEKHPNKIIEVKCTKDDIINGRWRTMLAEKYYKSPQQPEVSQDDVPNQSNSQATGNKKHNYVQCSSPSDPFSNKAIKNPDGTETKWRDSKTPGSGSKYFDEGGVEGKYRYADHWHTIKIKSFAPRQCPQFKNPNGAISFTIIIEQATNQGHINNFTPSDKDWRKFLKLFNAYETELLWNNGATIDKTAKTITLKIPQSYDPGDSVPRQQLCELLRKYKCAVLS